VRARKFNVALLTFVLLCGVPWYGASISDKGAPSGAYMLKKKALPLRGQGQGRAKSSLEGRVIEHPKIILPCRRPKSSLVFVKRRRSQALD